MAPIAFLQAALNGSRIHPATPRTPDEIAAEAQAAVSAGAQSLHLHPYDTEGCETLDAKACALAIRAVREVCPGVSISLSTSAEIEADPHRRLDLIREWSELPDLVTANQGETGIEELCELMFTRGIGVEAGLLSAEDAQLFVTSGLAPYCRRVMIEPLDADPERALDHASRIVNGGAKIGHWAAQK